MRCLFNEAQAYEIWVLVDATIHTRNIRWTPRIRQNPEEINKVAAKSRRVRPESGKRVMDNQSVEFELNTREDTLSEKKRPLFCLWNLYTSYKNALQTKKINKYTLPNIKTVSFYW